jgi:hypothetical protein
MYRSKRGEKVGAAVVDVVQEYNMHRPFWSVCIIWRISTTRIYTGSTRALAGSSQHQHASLHLHAALCTSAVTLTMCRSRGPPPASSSPLGAYWTHTEHIQQPSGPSHHTTQSNNPPILPSVYIYSSRASPFGIRTETRLCKRASYDIHLSPDPQSTHAVDPDTFEYLPAQHRHASVHTSASSSTGASHRDSRWRS